MGFCQNHCIFHCLPVKIEYCCLPCVLFSFLKLGSVQAHSPAARWANSVHITFSLFCGIPDLLELLCLCLCWEANSWTKHTAWGLDGASFFLPYESRKKMSSCVCFHSFPSHTPFYLLSHEVALGKIGVRVVWSISKWLESWCVQVWADSFVSGIWMWWAGLCHLHKSCWQTGSHLSHRIMEFRLEKSF